MSEAKHTPGPWFYNKEEDGGHDTIEATKADLLGFYGVISGGRDGDLVGKEADLVLAATAPELLEKLIEAKEFIENLQQELHHRRIADWYPEGANNAALNMSEDMRLLGNSCADFDASETIAKATGSAA